MNIPDGAIVYAQPDCVRYRQRDRLSNSRDRLQWSANGVCDKCLPTLLAVDSGWCPYENAGFTNESAVTRRVLLSFGLEFNLHRRSALTTTALLILCRLSVSQHPVSLEGCDVVPGSVVSSSLQTEQSDRHYSTCGTLLGLHLYRFEIGYRFRWQGAITPCCR
jgi:hypothetical protein